MTTSALCLTLGAAADHAAPLLVDPFAALPITTHTAQPHLDPTASSMSPMPASPRTTVSSRASPRTLPTHGSTREPLPLPPSPKTKILDLTTTMEIGGDESQCDRNNLVRDQQQQEQRGSPQSCNGTGFHRGLEVLELLSPVPCPDSPPLVPTTAVHRASGVSLCSNGSSGINRTGRPPILPLANSSHSFENNADADADDDVPTPITPFALSPLHPSTTVPFPAAPTTAAGPPTPTSACTFGGYSPPPVTIALGTSTSPVAYRQESIYARRGSTGTFGGARSRGSIIQLPTSLTSIPIDEVVARASFASESSLTRSPPTQSSPLAASVPLGRTPPGGHCRPESPTAIMQYLMDARERNELAILPSEPNTASSTTTTPALPAEPTFHSPSASPPKAMFDIIKRAPPSSGTPLLQRLREEHSDGKSSPIDMQDDDLLLDLPSPQYWSNRHTAMFDLDEDHVDVVTHLRDRSLSEAERVLDGLCDTDENRANLSTEIPTDASPVNLSTSHLQNMQGMYRARSIESGSSGYADSTTTTSGLIAATNKPKASPKSLSRSNSFVLQAPPARLPAVLANKADLPADQKAVLIKRTRKLEKVLGEPLPENTVERFVVEPTMGPTTVATHIEDADWPRSKHDVPEWMREDCVPQRASRPASMVGEPPSSASTTRSRIARVLLGDPTPPVNTELRVYVSRERHVAETRDCELRERHRADVIQQGLASPNSAKSASPTNSTRPLASLEEAERRTRRLQLTKLQRMLGDPIPPAAINSPSPSDGEDHFGSVRSHAHTLLPSLTRTLSNSSSVLIDKREKWTSRFRRHHHRSESPTPSPTTATTQPPLSATLPADPALSSDALTASQRRLARKRATKLGKLFGDRPPPSLYMPSAAAAVAVSEVEDRERELEEETAGSAVFESYRHSINSLIYMVENDHERLVNIVDELEQDDNGSGSSRPLSPMTPAPTSPTLARASTWSSRNSFSRRASAPPLTLAGFSPPDEPLSPTLAAHPLLSPTSPTTGKALLPSSPPNPHSLSMRRRRTSKLAHFFGERASDFNDYSRPASSIFEVHNSADDADDHRPKRSAEDELMARFAPRPISSIGMPIGLGGRPPVEPIVHNGSPEKCEFHALRPPPPPRRRTPPAVPGSAPGSAGLGVPTPPPTALLAPTPATEQLPLRRPSSISIFPPVAGSSVVITGNRRPSVAAMRRRETLDSVLSEMWNNVQSDVRRGSVAEMEAARLEDMMGVLQRKRTSEAWAEL